MRLRKVRTSQRVDTSDDTLIEDVSNQERVIDRDEDTVKKADRGREYTADTQVEGSVVAAVPTVTAAPVKVAAPVKAVVPSTRLKRGVVI
nr:hypothetical protein [Tanacetum cinerariifolium]